MKEMFYICNHCGNIATKVKDANVPLVCCGEKMQPLVPNTVEASNEKHLPVVEVKDNLVQVNVGAVNHPMADEHFIEWVYLQTEKGGQMHYLKPGSEPQVAFVLQNDKPLAVYAYCNLHGLWKTDL